MLRDEYMSLLSVTSREELCTRVVDFTRQLGFDTMAAIVVVDDFPSASKFVWIDNEPTAFGELSENKEWCRRNPVAQHCKRSGIPIIWNQDTYTHVGAGELWEIQARFGYRTGIAVALHLPEGRHFCIGVDRDQALPRDRNELTRMAADLQLFAVHTQEAALRVLLPEVPPTIAPQLTPRELESLRWTMEGKTAWELGRILGISEQTAARHVNNATQKLGCVNKLQAVLKALRLRLIH